MIEFPTEIRERDVLMRLVGKALSNKDPIPSLSHLCPARSHKDLLDLANSWQDLGLVQVIESREEGNWYVWASIKDAAKIMYFELRQNSLVGRIGQFSRSDWISFGSLFVASAALLKDMF
ncbi:hypothetical protein [Sandarakinorhabdus sp.]|uniref:hypothetical protein n=1 Tax=Sandarakinorhabdus sp. TaxID=1916663 RepID=UPI00286D9325|nr:hypothetical protein [Sandarakinorhabdus sp.]